MTGFEVPLRQDTSYDKKVLISVFCGVIFGGVSIFLLLSCVSYVFVGPEAIQLDSYSLSEVLRHNAYVKNFCGVLGAKVASVVMRCGVGVGVFPIIFFFLFLYCKSLNLYFVKEISIAKVLVLCLLAVMYISMVLYYIYINFSYKYYLQRYIGYMTISFGEILEKYVFTLTLPLVIFISFVVFSLILERNILKMTLLCVFNLLKKTLQLLL